MVWNIFYFSIYWECHHPNWRTHIFRRGKLQPPTSQYQLPFISWGFCTPQLTWKCCFSMKKIIPGMSPSPHRNSWAPPGSSRASRSALALFGCCVDVLCRYHLVIHCKWWKITIFNGTIHWFIVIYSDLYWLIVFNPLAIWHSYGKSLFVVEESAISMVISMLCITRG